MPQHRPWWRLDPRDELEARLEAVAAALEQQIETLRAEVDRLRAERETGQQNGGTPCLDC